MEKQPDREREILDTISLLIAKAKEKGLIPTASGSRIDRDEMAVYGDDDLSVGFINTRNGDLLLLSIQKISETRKMQLKGLQSGLYIPTILVNQPGNDMDGMAMVYSSSAGEGPLAVTSTRTSNLVNPSYTLELIKTLNIEE